LQGTIVHKDHAFLLNDLPRLWGGQEVQVLLLVVAAAGFQRQQFGGVEAGGSSRRGAANRAALSAGSRR
jgi:hypothetical protein